MTLPADFVRLAPYFDDGGPASDALAAHEHVHGLLLTAREKVRDLSSPSRARAAEALDDAAAIEAASKRKAAPRRTNTERLAADLAAARELVDALVRHIDAVRRDALTALADDAPRRLEAAEERRTAAVERVRHLRREMGEALADIDAVAEVRAVLAAVAEGNALADAGQVAAVTRAAAVANDRHSAPMPRDQWGDVPVEAALDALVAHAEREGEVRVYEPSPSVAERLGQRVPSRSWRVQ